MCMKPTNDDCSWFWGAEITTSLAPKYPTIFKGLQELIRILDYTTDYRVIIIFILKGNTLL